MIFNNSLIKVNDNTGVKKVKCIKVFKKPFAVIGDKILVSIQKTKNLIKKKRKIALNKSVKIKGVVVRIKKNTPNRIGNFINFYENSIILINDKNEPIGTKIMGPIPVVLRTIKKLKIISLSNYLI